jgi:hypothetical protein
MAATDAEVVGEWWLGLHREVGNLIEVPRGGGAHRRGLHSNNGDGSVVAVGNQLEESMAPKKWLVSNAGQR